MTNESHSTEDIEHKIAHEREGLANALNDLQEKFSIDSIAHEVTNQFREHGGEIGRSVSDSVKRNPLGLALTGVGLAWLIMGDKKGERTRDDSRARFDRSRYNNEHYNEQDRPIGLAGSGAPPYPYAWDPQGDKSSGQQSRFSSGQQFDDSGEGAIDKARDAASSVAERAENVASAASERTSAWREKLEAGTENFSEEARHRVISARERAIHARSSAAAYASHGRDRAVGLFEEQPLVAGSLAVAFGAALGAALPPSQIENRYIGERSDKLMNEAERIFEEEKQKAGKVAKAASDEAKHVADEAKYHADNAAPAHTVEQAVADEAKSSGQRIADAAETEAKRQKVGDIDKS